jgi:hypothetical protein
MQSIFRPAPACLIILGIVLVSVLGTCWPGSHSSGCAESPQEAHVKGRPPNQPRVREPGNPGMNIGPGVIRATRKTAVCRHQRL